MSSPEVLEIVRNFTLMDDDFMTAVLHDAIPATELVLRIIMDKPELKVHSVKTQEKLKNISGHSLTLDVLASDSSGKWYNIEVQNESSGAAKQRARYHSALMDGNLLKAGEKFSGLPESYVIFITRNDVLGGGLPIYRIERVILETGQQFGDGAHILYVNGKNRDQTPLGLLMRDFHCKNAEEMHYPQLAERVSHFKDSEGGQKTMCAMVEEYGNRRALQAKAEGMAEGKAEGKIEGRIEGKVEGRIEVAGSLLKLGALTKEQIAAATGLSLELIQSLALKNG